MNATIEQVITNEGPGIFTAKVEAFVDGEMVFELDRRYEKSNEVYAAYKTIQSVVSYLSRFGATTVTIKTNCAAVVRELNGEKNLNKTLLLYTLNRIEEVGIKINEVRSS